MDLVALELRNYRSGRYKYSLYIGYIGYMIIYIYSVYRMSYPGKHAFSKSTIVLEADRRNAGSVKRLHWKELTSPFSG